MKNTWKPKIGELVYTLDFDCYQKPVSMGSHIWANDKQDREDFKKNRIFRTLSLAQQAIVAVKTVLKIARKG